MNLIWDTETFNALKLRLQVTMCATAYDKSKMHRRSEGQIINNLNGDGAVQSGANARMVQAVLGRSMDMSHEGDWNVYAGYKYIQPDALPDAYNDSSFHLGGTTPKGITRAPIMH